MSQISTISPKHCAKKGFSIDKINKKLLYTISTFFLSLLSLIVLIWLILHPAKPQFSLKQTDIYKLNLSSPYLLNSSVQITLESKNPNQKVGIYYDQLLAYASYKGQQITAETPIPAFYQGNQDSNLLSASLVGDGIPVAPSFGYEVGRDQVAGKLVLILKVDGRIRWKVGTWVSSRYRINVNCVAVVSFGPTNPTSPISTKQGTTCSTTI
ncbi:NDR1/HIN1-like protein 26 [Ancistrocladus abbreviatus]